jgi:hypothetical protein
MALITLAPRLLRQHIGLFLLLVAMLKELSQLKLLPMSLAFSLTKCRQCKQRLKEKNILSNFLIPFPAAGYPGTPISGQGGKSNFKHRGLCYKT